MEMRCQKELFALDPNIHYFNGAAYGPGLKSGLEKGYDGFRIKACRPHEITSANHLEQAARVRGLFSDLIGAGDADRIAMLPAVSYGLAIVANNLHRLPEFSSKKAILLIQEDFPDEVYAFQRVALQHHLEIRSVEVPAVMEGRGKAWNASILESIGPEVAMVVVPHVHWIYGTLFDLEAIGRRCREMGALLVVDGTQSVGILPFDTAAIRPDALICAGYKWMFGPYGIALGYFGPFFDEGIPVEENWVNRVESDHFAGLTRYLEPYRPKAQRYNMGEFAQFAQMPVLEDALRQILDWGVADMQEYCRQLTANCFSGLKAMGCQLEESRHRAGHLVGMMLPEAVDRQLLFEALRSRQIYASLRGDAIRLSVNVYNTEEDVMVLENTMKTLLVVS
jgi:selenocysteine lyase/cysteine desulfurase